MQRPIRYILIVLAILLARPADCGAQQFRKEAFSQNYQDIEAADSSKALFSFKEYFGGITHQREARIGTLFGGSMVFLGGQQMYNRQYWKLPVFYGGIGAGVGLGITYRHRYNLSRKAYDSAVEQGLETLPELNEAARIRSNWCFAGAGLFYWAMLMDGTFNYNRDNTDHQPGKATIYSILLPGLGQVYNGEAWKIPIYWAGLATSWYFYSNSSLNYKRYKRIHNEATGDNAASYDGPISAETALYYRDTYRRYRDYSVLAIAAVYLLQVIDANVFAYMQDFELSDDISLRVEPTLLAPDNAYAFQGAAPPGMGLRIGLTF